MATADDKGIKKFMIFWDKLLQFIFSLLQVLLGIIVYIGLY